jgi:hypothetical protein
LNEGSTVHNTQNKTFGVQWFAGVRFPLWHFVGGQERSLLSQTFHPAKPLAVVVTDDPTKTET